ncbi:MAG: hypothetical protein RQ760_17200 [Sedimentisphaerales bacterium]|nr:hypothetical protein [Sedimentisphaerales bacterium]
MSVEKISKAKPPKKSATKIIKLILIFIVILIVLAFLLVPAFISSKGGNRYISGKINNSIDGRIDFAGLSMGWFKGISIAGLSFADNAETISVQVKQITTKPRYGSILTGNLSFGQTTIDQPKISINLKDQPVSESGSVGVSKSNPAKAGYLALVMDVAVNDGNFKLTDSKAKTVELSQINSKLSLRPPGRQTDFDINLAVANSNGEKSQIHAEGKITPDKAIRGWSLKGTSGDLIVEVNDLDLESLGSILELAKIDVQVKGMVSADINAVIKDGNFENLTGSIKAKNLDVTGPALNGDNLKTKLLNVAVKLKSQQQLIKIEQFQFNSDWLVAQAGGMVPTTFSSWSDFLTSESDVSLNADFELDAAAALSQMPHTFGIKEEMKITSGKLSGNITANRGKLNGQVNLKELTGTIEDKKLALSQPVTGKLQISTDKKKIRFDELDVTASFAKINASGFLEQLKYDGYVDLKKLQSEFGQFVDLGQYEIAGEVFEQGTLLVNKSEITGSGASQIKNLSISAKDGTTAQEPGADIKFAFAVDRKTQVLTFNSIEANASLGQININRGIFPLGGNTQVPVSMDISAKKVDLEKVKPFAVLFASLPKETQLAGIAESKISINSEKEIYKVKTDSTKIQDLKFVYPGEKPFDANEALLVLDAEINPKEKTINIKKLEFDTPQIKIRKGEFNKLNNSGKTKLTGQAELEYDWAALSVFTAPFLPEGLTLKGQRKDSVSFLSEYATEEPDKLMANLTADAKLGFGQAGYMGLDFGPTDVDIQIRNGLLKIKPFETTVNEGLFSFAGQVDFNQKPAQLKMAEPLQLMKNIKINDQTTKKLLMYLNPIFADAVNASGIASFNCEQLTIPLDAAAKNQVEVAGTVSMDQLRMQASGLLSTIFSAGGTSARDAVITIHPTKFVLRDGFLRYDDMQMDIGDNPVNFKGVIGLDKSLDMTVTLPYTADGRTVRVGQATTSQRIKVPLRGTVDKPELDVGKLLEGQLLQQLEKQLPNLLEQLLK